VFDKEAIHKNVEDVMAEAVSAQMQVAKAMVEIEREPIVEAEAEAAPEPETDDRLTVGDLFKLHGRKKINYRQRKRKMEVPEQQMSFIGALQPAG
jgi:hypothetical protein